jgi:hypothetical protein
MEIGAAPVQAVGRFGTFLRYQPLDRDDGGGPRISMHDCATKRITLLSYETGQFFRFLVGDGFVIKAHTRSHAEFVRPHG